MEAGPHDQITRRFNFNLERVSHLMTVHELTKEIDTINKEYHSDLLRSAVVLLHSTVEDLMRELMRIKSAIDPSFLYEYLRFPHPNDAGKLINEIQVSYLHRFRGHSVNDLIAKCVEKHLERRSFNDKEDIIAAIKTLGLKEQDFKDFYKELERAVKRRHVIVHQGDRVSHDAKTHGKRYAMVESDVATWLATVRGFGEMMLERSKPSK